MYVPDVNSSGLLTKRVGDYIENDFDVFNSKLLKFIPFLPSMGAYQITKYPYRLDLISDEIYGSQDYGEALLLYNNKSIRDLHLGSFVNIFNRDSYDRLTLNINNI